MILLVKSLVVVTWRLRSDARPCTLFLCLRQQ